MSNGKRLWIILTGVALVGTLQFACGGGMPPPPTKIPATSTPAPTSTPSAQDHFDQGFVYLEQGQLDQAAAEFQKAIELDPQNAATHRNLGTVYARQGKLEEAVAVYEEAIKIAPDFGEAYGDMAGVLADLGRIPEAIATGEKAIELAPDYASAHNNLGIAYSRQGDLEKAIAEYKEAARLDPNDPQPHANLGIVYKDLGRLDEAVTELQEAIRLAPDDPENYNHLAIAYYMQGKTDETIDELLKVLAIDPDHANAHKNLGIAYSDLGRIEEAITELETYLQLFPDAPDQAVVEEMITELEKMAASPLAEYRNDEGGYNLLYPKNFYHADEDGWSAFSESQEAVDIVFEYSTGEAIEQAPVIMIDAMSLEDTLDDYDLTEDAGPTEILLALAEEIDAEVGTPQAGTIDDYPASIAGISGDMDGTSFEGALAIVIVDDRVIGVFGLALPDQWDAFFPIYLDMANSLSFFEP